MTLAVLEGATFALKDCLEADRRNGIEIKKTKLCGGGEKNHLWRKIVTNVMNMPVDIPQTEQGPTYGVAMLAMVGCGEYISVKDVAKAIVKVQESILPDKNIAVLYDKKYKVFQEMYPALKNI